MTTMNISLPDEMKTFIESQMSREGFASASEYLRALIREAQKHQARQDLEAKLLEGLQGPVTEMTPEDWESIRREALEGLPGGIQPIMSRIVRRHAARLDLIATYRHYAQEAGPAVANRFLAQAEATLTRLVRRPGLGTLYNHEHPALTDVRYFPISRFKTYLVFYRPRTGGIEVLRILHGARDLDSILTRDSGEEAGPQEAP